MVQRAKTTVAECFLTSCVWAHFPWQVPTLCLDSIISPLPLCWVKDVCMFRCNLPLHFWQNDRGLLRATVVTSGVGRTPNKSQHRKLSLEKKILPPLLPGLELATFWSRVRGSTNELSWLNIERVDLFLGVVRNPPIFRCAAKLSLVVS